MQNELMGLTGDQLTQLTELEADIRAHVQNAAMSITAIGWDLHKAKALLDHGQWLPWLQRMNIPERTAQNYMRIAKAADDGSPLATLPYSKALAALSMPREDLERAAQEHDLNDMTAAEIKRLGHELAEAREAARQAGAMAKEQLDRALQAEKDRRALQMRLEDITKEPQVVEKEVAPPDYEQLKQQLASTRRRLDEAEEAAAEAEERANSLLVHQQMAAMAEERRDGADVDGFVAAAQSLMSIGSAMPFMLHAMTDEQRDTVWQYASAVSDLGERISSALTDRRRMVVAEAVSLHG